MKKNVKRGALRDVSVAVVGGGFSGIAAGVQLAKAGCRDFQIFESSSGAGGTWWDSRYPGAQVDTPSHLYSYSFKRHDWSQPYASHGELREYLHQTIEEYGLGVHFRLNVSVQRAEWDQSRCQYLVELDSGHSRYFDVVISAVGMLTEPRTLDLPGMGDFRGDLFHTSRWDESLDLRGKKVAIIGTGSTAAQVVPAVADVAQQVTVFQRQPSWVEAKPNAKYTSSERRKLSQRIPHRLERLRRFYAVEKLWFGGRLIRPGTKADTRSIAMSREYLQTVFATRPDLLELMTPHIPYQGRRPVHATGFLEAFTKNNVVLVPQAATGFTESAVVAEDATEYDADVVIMATGFQPSNYLARLEVVGREGQTIQDYWNGEPKAFLGVTVPTFPNFFMLYGPNTNFYALVFGFESQAKFIIASLKKMVRWRATWIECRLSYFEKFNRWIHQRLAKTSWAVGDNYFKSQKTGRVVTQWPDGALVYGLLTRLLAKPSSRVGRKRDLGKSSQRREEGGESVRNSQLGETHSQPLSNHRA